MHFAISLHIVFGGVVSIFLLAHIPLTARYARNCRIESTCLHWFVLRTMTLHLLKGNTNHCLTYSSAIAVDQNLVGALLEKRESAP